jgi:thiamine-monophosphate kinase
MEITENRLVKKIARFCADGDAVLRGIGDDGAVVRLDAGEYVFVQDAMVERIHFDFAIQSAYSVGRKAIYINVSDVLAMGAEPRYFLSTIGVPPRISAADRKSVV